MGKMTKANADKQRRIDGWRNTLTGINTARDNRTAADFAAVFLGEYEVEELWDASGMAARAIELPIEMQLRNGFTVGIASLDAVDARGPGIAEKVDAKRRRRDSLLPTKSEDVAAAEDKLDADLDELEIVARVIEARQWARGFGGCATLVGLDDGERDLSKAVRWNTLKAPRYFVNLRPSECWPVSWNTNPLSGRYGMPVVYKVQRSVSGGATSSDGFRVHHTRIIRWPGAGQSKRNGRNRGWGRSVLDRMVEKLRDYDISFAAMPILISEFAQAIVSMDGLAEMFASKQDDIVQKRVEAVEMMSTFLKTKIIDSKDKYERVALPVAGVTDIFDRVVKGLAAEINIPAPLMMGDQPAGLNATGDSTIRGYYDFLAGDRRRTLTPQLNQIITMLFRSSEGPTAGFEPSKWSIEYGPMWLPTPKEESDVRYQVAQADSLYVTAGVLMPEEVAANRFGGDRWNMETRLDIETRDAMEKAELNPTALATKPPEPPTNDPTNDPAKEKPTKEPAIN